MLLHAEILNHQKLLETQTFWDNRDWDWYRENIPFFECPDAELTTTYYYRWELVTKHLTYGSPNSGYSFTEFIDRPFWSGAYGAISCPAGHQLYEVRWLRNPRFARDYTRYWFRTPGAQPRRYSCWLADSAWAVHEVHPEAPGLIDLLGDLIKNYEGWEQSHFEPEMALFWQTGHDDGMEFNINSRQTQDIVRGAPGYRPSFNAYMWADALAIARVADLAGDPTTAAAYRAKAAALKDKLQKLLWDPKREFFFPMSMREERDKEGNIVQARTLTHQSGKFAGSPHGREEIGFVPWQFGLPDRGYEHAWKFLMDPEYFFTEFGPTTVERRDPMFYLSPSCCWWSGQSWPYATTQTLKAMANLLRDYEQDTVTRADYLKLLRIYSRTHRKAGRPYVAEAAHPDTGSFEGHDGYNHSEHYFHSGFNDLIITGLIGLRPGADATLEVDPLAPAGWDYFAIDDVAYHGHRVSVLWDRQGDRYGMGAGLHLVVDGQALASSPTLKKLTATLPAAEVARISAPALKLNYAVNNEGTYYPRVTVSSADPRTPGSYVNDGNYWYHVHPPNRWTCAGSSAEALDRHVADECAVDFGRGRTIDTVKLYFLDDGDQVIAPDRFELQFWDGQDWNPIPSQSRTPDRPIGHRANVIKFPALATAKVRAVLYHAPAARVGMTEFETWGEGTLPYESAPPPAGNLALNLLGEGYPKATASFTDRYGGDPMASLDGKVVFRPSPMNRWTSYGSTNDVDWLEIDFGKLVEVGRLELYLYDDRGGVQAPERYTVEYWKDEKWKEVSQARRSPEVPAGGVVNSISFSPVSASKLRMLLVNKGRVRSGVTEVEAWRE